jgi:CheY-like chemotaxis protein
VRQNLVQIKSASLRAADIVKQLLSFGREAEHHLAPLDLTALVHEELDFIRSTFPSSVDIRADLPAGPVPVLGDRVQLKQVMINLFTNAVQAMEGRGGTILVSLSLGRRQTAGPEQTSSPAACLVIQDSGPGIREENLDRVFDPYFTTKDVGKGSGMGLAVVHSIVKHHKGHIDVSSRDGARFEVMLPLTKSPLPDRQNKAPRPSPLAGAGEKILVVDDERLIVRTSTEALERLGYTVQGVTDPMAAWALFSSDPEGWDLVITDMTMPGMTGDVLAGKMQGIRQDIPIILCTGYNALPDHWGGSERLSLLQKPVTLEELAGNVRRVLDRPK